MENEDKDMNLAGFLKEEKPFLKEMEKIDVDKNWSRFITTIKRGSNQGQTATRVRRYRFVFRYAAAVLLLVAATVSIYLATVDSPHQIIRASTGPRYLDLELDDGTVISLNKEAVISYPEKLKRRKREVILSGEAHFEVKHAERSPFYVQLETHTAKVIGTSFNIKEVQTGEIEVSVIEGVVSFFRKGMEQEAVRIDKGQQCTYHPATDDFTTDTVKSNNYLFWKTGILSYLNVPLSEVFDELEYFYGQRIVISDSIILNNSWNSTHAGQDLMGILDELCLYFDLKTIVKDDVILVQRE